MNNKIRTDAVRHLFEAILTLENEEGELRQLLVEDDWLYAKGIDEGDPWPQGAGTQG